MIDIEDDDKNFEEEDKVAEYLIKENDMQILNNVKKWDRGIILQSISETKRYKIPFKVKKERFKTKLKNTINRILRVI